MSKNTKVTIERNLVITSLTYAQLYLEQRIVTCKLANQDTSEYEQELARINQLVKTL